MAAKRSLLYLFLKRRYKRVDVVFIRHTSTAEEVDEENPIKALAAELSTKAAAISWVMISHTMSGTRMMRANVIATSGRAVEAAACQALVHRAVTVVVDVVADLGGGRARG